MSSLFSSGLFPSVRGRLLGILILAAVPIFFIAASIAVQNRDMLQERSHHRTALLLAVASAREAAEAANIEQLMRGLATLLGERSGPEDGCRRTLGTVMALATPRPLELFVAGAGGHILCRAGAPGPRGGTVAVSDTLAPSLAAARDRPGFTWHLPEPGGAEAPPILSVVLGLARPGRDAPDNIALLVASFAADWFLGSAAAAAVPGGAAWLVGPDARLFPLSSAAADPAAAPGEDALATVLAHDNADTIALSRSGRPYAYTAGSLAGGLRLLVGAPARGDLLRANWTLGWRLLELGLLMLAGLLATVIGAHVAVVRPIRHLTESVRIWRNGGAFDANPADGAPREVVELAHTFGEATTALRSRELDLHTASARQDLLMQEIHHRVKNNLQIVASLLNLQSSRIRQPQARAEFQAARDRIRALATLHRHLYAHGELHTINMRAFLAELCGQLLQAIGETPAGGRIQLDITAPELQISSDRAVPMALIVTEAVSNSAKYAFPGGRGGHITVALEPIETDPESVRLLIKDNGVGIPAGRAETEAGVRDGIGIQLIRGFARQLGATLEVTHDGGTRYELCIPLHRERPEQESLERVTEPA